MRGFIAITLLVAAAGLVVTGTPAAASLPGVVLETDWSQWSSDQSQTAVAECPAGTKVIGTGADIFGGTNEEAIEQILPDIGKGTVTVTAKETDPDTHFWQVEALAICAPEPAGLVTVLAGRGGTSRDKTVTAVCPGSKTVLGWGYDVGSGFGEVLVNQAIPDGSSITPATQVTVSAYEEDSYSRDWSLDVTLICAKPIATQHVISATQKGDIDYKSVEAACPTGESLTGGGGAATTNTPSLNSEVLIDSSYPFSYSVGPPDVLRMEAAEEDPLLITEKWTLAAYALCV
jgi:hypothetical protein